MWSCACDGQTRPASTISGPRERPSGESHERAGRVDVRAVAALARDVDGAVVANGDVRSTEVVGESCRGEQCPTRREDLEAGAVDDVEGAVDAGGKSPCV